MRILIVNHYSGSPALGMEFRHFALAREFRKAGHEVVIVASRFSHLRRLQPGAEHFAAAALDDIPHVWLAGNPYRGNGASRAANMFGFGADLWQKSSLLARQWRPDVVYASSPHPFLTYGALRLARKAHALYLFEVRDLWPASLVQLFGISSRNPMAIAMDRAEAHGCRNADLVNSLLPNAAAYFADRGVAPGRYLSVSNGIDEDDWQESDEPLPEAFQRHFERERAAGRRILAYTGTFGPANCLDNLLDAASLLRDSNVSVLLVGAGMELPRLKHRVEAERLDNVTLLPSVPKRLMPALLHEVDFCYAGYKPQPMYEYGVCANKLMDYMMAGKVVTLAINSAVDAVSKSGGGRVCAPEDPVALADAARELASRSDAQLAEMGARARAFILSEHTYPILAERLLAAIGTRTRGAAT